MAGAGPAQLPQASPVQDSTKLRDMSRGLGTRFRQSRQESDASLQGYKEALKNLPEAPQYYTLRHWSDTAMLGRACRCAGGLSLGCSALGRPNLGGASGIANLGSVSDLGGASNLGGASGIVQSCSRPCSAQNV